MSARTWQGDLELDSGTADFGGAVTAGSSLTVSTGNLVVATGDAYVTAGDLTLTAG